MFEDTEAVPNPEPKKQSGSNARAQVSVGEWYAIDKKPWRMERRLRNSVLFVDPSGMDAQLTDEQIISLNQQGSFYAVPNPLGLPGGTGLEADVALDLVSPKARNTAFFRRDVVVEWITRKSGVSMAQCLSEVLARRTSKGEWIPSSGVSERNAFRWVGRWKKAGCPIGVDARLFLPQQHLSGYRREHYDPFVRDTLVEAIKRALAVGLQIDVRTLHGKVAAEIRDEYQRLIDAGTTPPKNLRVPSVKYVRACLNDATPEELYKRKYGKRLARDQFRPVGVCPEAFWSLQVVEIDHTQADTHVVDENGLPIGRPYVTVVIDRYSRMILGIHVSLEPPSWIVLATTLRQAIMHKDWLRVLYPSVKNAWPCSGPPTVAVVDNGVEFHGTGFKDACAGLNINVEYAPIRMPQYKAKVERFFRTIKLGLMQTLPGGTSSDARRNEAFGTEQGARFTLEEFRELVFKWVIDIYHYRQHDKLGGRRPIDVWNEGLEKRGGLPLTPPEEDMLPLFGVPEERALSDKGIEHLGLFFNDGEYGHVRRIRNQKRGPAKHRVRVNHVDLRYVWVEDPEQRRWFKIPCTTPEKVTVTLPNGAQVGKTLAERKRERALEIARAAHLDRISGPAVARAQRDVFDKAVAAAERPKPKKRRATARLAESRKYPYSVEEPERFEPVPPFAEQEGPVEEPTCTEDVDELEALARQLNRIPTIPNI